MGNCPWGEKVMLFIGLFFISMATLALETLQMRLFSFTLWHHMAYFVISMALLGFGASGSFLAAFPGLFNTSRWQSKLSLLCLSFSFSLILAFLVGSRLPLDVLQLFKERAQGLYLLLHCLLLSIPFFFSGLCISLLFFKLPHRSHLLYAFNLMGSALGCLLFFIIIKPLGGEGSVVFLACMGALASFFFAWKIHRALSGLCFLSLVGLGLFLPWGKEALSLNAAPGKELNQMTASLEYTSWTPLGRIDVASLSGPQMLLASKPLYPGLLSADEQFILRHRKRLLQDGSAGTWMINFTGDLAEVSSIQDTLYSMAFKGQKEPRVLIIGVGGGADVLAALFHGASSVTGVEIHKEMVNLLKGPYDSYLGHLFTRDGVQLIASEGRSFVRRSQETYDVIQMSMVDTLSALSSGAYVYSENYLYTQEAFVDYLNHLKEDGVLAIIRFRLEPPRESLKLCSMAVGALREMGFQRPEEHLLVMGDANTACVLVRKRPFFDQEIALYENLSRRLGYLQILYSPRLLRQYAQGNSLNAFSLFMRHVQEGREEAFFQRYPYQVKPARDDKPFFFQYTKGLWSLKSIYGTYLENVEFGSLGLVLLMALLFISVLFSCFFILFPLFIRKQKRMIPEPCSLSPDSGGLGETCFPQRGAWGAAPPKKAWVLLFFLSLGVGFMLLEISLMQKYALFLGHPLWSIALVLSSLLFFSGLGSLLSGEFLARRNHLLPLFCGLLAFFILALGAFLPHLFHLLLGSGMVVKVLVTLVTIGPLAFLMGMPFPWGLKTVAGWSDSLVPWAWAVNACASVVSSILAILLALSFGFSFVLLLGSIFYLLAMGSSFALSRGLSVNHGREVERDVLSI